MPATAQDVLQFASAPRRQRPPRTYSYRETFPLAPRFNPAAPPALAIAGGGVFGPPLPPPADAHLWAEYSVLRGTTQEVPIEVFRAGVPPEVAPGLEARYLDHARLWVAVRLGPIRPSAG